LKLNGKKSYFLFWWNCRINDQDEDDLVSQLWFLYVVMFGYFVQGI